MPIRLNRRVPCWKPYLSSSCPCAEGAAVLLMSTKQYRERRFGCAVFCTCWANWGVCRESDRMNLVQYVRRGSSSSRISVSRTFEGSRKGTWHDCVGSARWLAVTVGGAEGFVKRHDRTHAAPTTISQGRSQQGCSQGCWAPSGPMPLMPPEET